MKFAHLADLHIGKRINNFSMLEEQKHILSQILNMLYEENVDALLIAGDIYDIPLPPVEAVHLLDKFLTQLSQADIKVLMISGNHDSAQRLSFGSELLDKSGIYIAPVFNGLNEPITFTDEFGPLHIYLLPFLKPLYAKRAWPEEKIESYEDAVQTAVDKMKINEDERNIIVAHQFVTGAQTSDSEEISIGGLDNISASIFFPFDYAALGHIHRPQQIGRESIRYAGTPLKYSFSECSHEKTVTFIELHEKGNIYIYAKKLRPLHDMRLLRGSYEELTLRDNYRGTAAEDYLSVTLTDEKEIPDAISRLRTIYPNIMKITYDNKRTQNDNVIEPNLRENAQPIELLDEFYALQNNQECSAEQKNFAQSLIEEIWEKKI